MRTVCKHGYAKDNIALSLKHTPTVTLATSVIFTTPIRCTVFTTRIQIRYQWFWNNNNLIIIEFNFDWYLTSKYSHHSLWEVWAWFDAFRYPRNCVKTSVDLIDSYFYKTKVNWFQRVFHYKRTWNCLTKINSVNFDDKIYVFFAVDNARAFPFFVLVLCMCQKNMLHHTQYSEKVYQVTWTR